MNLHFRHSILCFLFLLFAWKSQSQGDLRLYQWADHLPYNEGVTVTQSASKVYYGTNDALIAISKEDSTQAEFFSKVNGLSDAGPSWIKYHHALHKLIVGYKNGNIDILDSNGVININDILRNTSIQGDKRINHIYTDNTDSIYLSTPFGMVILDIGTGQFKSTVFTPTPAYALTWYNGKFYLATEAGLYAYDLSGSGIIEDFSQWEKVHTINPNPHTSQFVNSYNGKLYAGINGQLHEMENDTMKPYYTVQGFSVKYISTEGPTMIVGYRCNGDCAGKVLYFLPEPQGFWHEHGQDCVLFPTYAIEDEKGRVWYADLLPPIKIADKSYGSCKPLIYDKPLSGSVSEMEIEDGVLYVATGGVSESYGYLHSREGFMVYDGDKWLSYNERNTPFILVNDLLMFFRILPDPFSDKLYIGTYWGGLLEKDGDNYTLFNDSNSSLQGAVGDPDRERITGMAFDEEGNLWVMNFLAERPLSVRKRDGTWKSFDLPCSGITNVSQIVIDHRGWKWIMLYSKSASLIVYDDNGTIDNEADDRCVVLSSSNTEIPSNSIQSLAVDLEGDIWVGTTEGPVVFDGGGDVFHPTNPHQGSRIKVEQDDVLNYLLGEETIYTIAVDGANRKWFGTNSGVFVQSPAANEEVVAYNTSNSPLLDNRIIDIAIDPDNGVVYIATAGGIMSVRTDAVVGGIVHDENAYAFPNPVRPGYEGPIAIRGLARDAVVKITDVRGQLVFETRALGGQAIWDGRDLNGEKATTGVYLVFSVANSDGFSKPDALVTKILVVN